QADGDGVLTMEEILGLRLNADWVVLSACNTASGSGAGSEAVSGLGRAFFYAGARALLVSNWPVETTSARALTTELFQRQQANPNLTRAQALQQTMNWLMDAPGFVDATTNTVLFSYGHPIFWAPFTLVGDSGGGSPTGK
ncbi:MAG: CHAT domain-containing protein, partial [candidate division NC10 bacterium]|nr:CHAT domain-containing protein [candidate division NC10 bacterium]